MDNCGVSYHFIHNYIWMYNRQDDIIYFITLGVEVIKRWDLETRDNRVRANEVIFWLMIITTWNIHICDYLV